MHVLDVSFYSFFTALMVFNIGLIIIAILRRVSSFFVKNSTYILFVLFILSIIRLVIPLDISNAFIIRSFKIFPAIQTFLRLSCYKSVTYGMLMLFIWGGGIITVLTKNLVAYIISKQSHPNYTPIKHEQVQRVSKEIPFNKAIIVVSSDVDIPKVTGFLRAYIYLPPIYVSDEELRLILLHELQHIKNGDIFFKLFYIFLQAFVWWNPVVYIFEKEMDNLLELRCDASVTRYMNEESRLSYLDTILKVVKQTSFKYTKNKVSFSFVPPSKDEFIKQRFEIILNKKDCKNTTLYSLLLIIPLFFLSYFIIFQPASFPAESELTGKVVITNENSYLIYDKDGSIQLIVNDEFFGTISPEEMEVPPYSELKKIKRKD